MARNLILFAAVNSGREFRGRVFATAFKFAQYELKRIFCDFHFHYSHRTPMTERQDYRCSEWLLVLTCHSSHHQAVRLQYRMCSVNV